MTKQVTLIVKISENYKIKCSYIDSNKKETTIQLHNKEQEYLLSSSLIDNKSSIEFGSDLFTNPQEFKLYEIAFYGKEYNVIAQVLFALIIKEFTSQIEKEYIIEKTEVQLPKENKEFNFRILTALDSIGLKDIELEEEDIEYEYKNQGEILNEIIEKNESYRKRERMIERAKEINKEMKILFYSLKNG